MYTVTVTESPVCIAHQLHLPYVSKCNHLHGHNYRVVVKVEAAELNASGMVVDFTAIKDVIKKYDHSVIGIVYDGERNLVTVPRHYPEIEPSTAENFARHLYDELVAAVGKRNPALRIVEVRCYETESSEVICG